MRLKYLTIFLISLFCISLELFLTRILSLKTWNHLVYLIIPFSLLGYGIGANLYLLFRSTFNKFRQEKVIAYSLLITAISSLATTLFLIRFGIHLETLINFFANINSIVMLLTAYTAVVIPFIPVGFVVVYLFSIHPKESNKLYFFDLLGAGFGALAFITLIHFFAIFRSLLFLLIFLIPTALFFLLPQKRKSLIGASFLAVFLCFIFIKEPTQYAIDKAKDWENITGFFKPHQYETLVSRWNPLGRTEIHKIKDKAIKAGMLKNAYFQINLSPAPDLCYVATNCTAGTPIFHYAKEGLIETGSQIKLFSQPIEVPYAFGDRSNIVVIGAGGGRDIFIAKSHGAQQIIAAEINPTLYQEMRQGGDLFEYSGGIYEQDGVEVFNIDGRHLVKKLKDNKHDLVVLTGVDTFSGLANGAYTYAESYLYTKNAVMDYMKILNTNGVLNLNRRYFPKLPRESLRLFTISLDALKSLGIENPWDNIVVGSFQQWAFLLVKKSPFTHEERALVKEYFRTHNTTTLFPNDNTLETSNKNNTVFDDYARAFREGKEKSFQDAYPYDVSVITDDTPFFYKYYKFDFLKPFAIEHDRHTGTLIFITQILVFAQALFFIALFIFIPLIKFQHTFLQQTPKKFLFSFLTYFSSLGLGFMFIEIPLMQKFVLLLGSPIYSIAVTLTALLIFTGLGSLLSGKFTDRDQLLKKVTAAMVLIVLGIVFWGGALVEEFVGYGFSLRIMIVCLILLPIGLFLGVYFPSGLLLAGNKYPQTIAWAWGLNSGFSVLGSILAIILAQFWGFNTILILALGIYVLALWSYLSMKASLKN